MVIKWLPQPTRQVPGPRGKCCACPHIAYPHHTTHHTIYTRSLIFLHDLGTLSMTLSLQWCISVPLSWFPLALLMCAWLNAEVEFRCVCTECCCVVCCVTMWSLSHDDKMAINFFIFCVVCDLWIYGAVRVFQWVTVGKSDLWLTTPDT